LALALFAATTASAYLTGGATLAAAVMAILLAHEMGHFVACRVHRVACTWPYFLPAPFLDPFAGTLGAVMAIRDRFPNRRVLFDVGVAGPLAGMAVCLPVLFLGIHEASVLATTTAVDDSFSLSLGEPLLLTLAIRWIHGPLADGATVLLGPLGIAAWFGLLLTGLNLIPIGQFDGGHILYALLPRHAHRLAHLAWWVCLGLAVLGPHWLVWALMTRALGRRHPPTLDDGTPLDPWRVLVGIVALAVFILTLIPQPILHSWPMLYRDLQSLAQALGLAG
jgi:membrane-associated protease RseP (regulator of RpoE activity)